MHLLLIISLCSLNLSVFCEANGNNFDSFGRNDTLLLNNFNKEIIQPYLQCNNLFREQVYVHFNKS